MQLDYSANVDQIGFVDDAQRCVLTEYYTNIHDAIAAEDYKKDSIVSQYVQTKNNTHHAMFISFI